MLQIKHHLESGKSLANSIMQSTNAFKPMIFNLIHIGEQSGQLSFMLNRLADDLDKEYQFKKKLQQALFYPSLILMVAIIVSLIMLIVVVPRFATMFNDMKIALPRLTQGVIQISHSICQSYFILLPILISIISLYYCLKNSRRFQSTIADFTQTIPVLGSLAYKTRLVRFAQNLKITFSAGISITEGLKLMAKEFGDSSSMSKRILNLHNEITKGKQLHQALSKHSFFPILLVQMIKIGEEAGMLDKMLDKIVTLYESELDRMITMVSQLIEPLIMIILGVVIGGLVLAMYLPIFKLGAIV